MDGWIHSYLNLSVHKAPFTWYLKEMLVLGVYLSLFVYMLGFDVFGIGVFGSSAASSSSLFGGVGRLRAGAAFLAGAMLQAFSFCTLHDASHYGLWFKVYTRVEGCHISQLRAGTTPYPPPC